MLGEHTVIVENAYLRYEFTLCRNLTIVRGDSATGKTTLVEMVRAYNEEDDTGIDVRCDKKTSVLYGKNWMQQLSMISDSIVFIDEQSRFVRSHDFARAIRGTDNYYVIVTREKLAELPYSITEIYGIRNSGKYSHLKREYIQNEFYRIYGERPNVIFKPDVIVTEDSNSGFDFFSSISQEYKCVSASGKSNVLKKLKEMGQENVRYLAVVDGAAFGSEIDEILQYIRYKNENVEVYAPESFEYLLLTSGIFKDREIEEKCQNTQDFADSVRYLSWEQFYTDLITEITGNTPMRYSKAKLNVYYLSERNKELILSTVPECLRLG